jgi:hypothetical protein
MTNPIINILRNRYVFTFFAILIVLLIGVILLRQKRQEMVNQQPEQIQTSLSPTLPVPTIPLSDTFVVSGVTVKNFYKNDSERNSSNDVSVFENEDYSITYVASFEQFIMTLWSPDFLRIRPRAEAKFLELVGVDRESACRLNVEESIPIKVESEYAGGSYNLSFCK